MKIGLLAYQNSINYGAVLQMYALKTKLEQYNHLVRTINYQCESIEKINGLNRSPYVSKNIKHHNVKSLYLRFEHLRTQKRWEEKYYRFKEFRETYLDLTDEYQERCELNNIKFETIIVGSDQIWNPNITNGFDPVYFCDFKTSEDVKKLAYSASCGSVKTIIDQKEKFLDLINNFNSISARENELTQFINSRSDHKAERTLDPSLLLELEEYDKIAQLPAEEKFLLIYKMQDNKELYKTAQVIAKRKGLKIIELGFPPLFKKNNIEYISNASPNEFLGYFKKASFVVTNSFHGTAFSIKFNKEFLTVPHRSVGQRMIDLLKLLNLEERIITQSNQLDDIKLSNINYELVNKRLNDEIDNSLSFILNSIS